METGTGKLRFYFPHILSPRIENNPEISKVLKFRVILDAMVRIRVRIPILTQILTLILTIDELPMVTF